MTLQLFLLREYRLYIVPAYIYRILGKNQSLQSDKYKINYELQYCSYGVRRKDTQSLAIIYYAIYPTQFVDRILNPHNLSYYKQVVRLSLALHHSFSTHFACAETILQTYALKS